MTKTKDHKTILRAARPLAVVAAVLPVALSALPVQAQDAMTNRYQAIRAPSQIQANRVARQRLQSELNALSRSETRIRNEIRANERLQFQDPVSRLPAQERALRSQLNRVDVDQRAVSAELNRLERNADTQTNPRRLSVGPFDPDAPVAAYAAPGTDPVSSEDAVAAARDFVEELLQANRARP